MGFSWFVMNSSVREFDDELCKTYHSRPPDRGAEGLKAPNISAAALYLHPSMRIEV